MGMTHNIGDVQRALATMAKQIPYARSRTTNGLALTAQKEIRQELGQHFTLRRPDFLRSSIRVKLGNKANPVAELGVPPRAGSSISENLALQEFGGTERPKHGRALAEPLQARPTKLAVTPPSRWPGALRRAFKIKTAGQELILQRVGKAVKQSKRSGKRDPNLRVQWALVPSLEVRPRWGFVAKCFEVAKRDAQALFKREWLAAIRTAK
jgi:hypothetical protein